MVFNRGSERFKKTMGNTFPRDGVAGEIATRGK